MSVKVFALPPRENWIVDQIVDDWYKYNDDISTHNADNADVIWLVADWCYNRFDYNLLKTKKVLTTIHHIVPEKFLENDRRIFMHRDNITDVYHVPNIHTFKFVQKLTTKPIHIIPYWANQNIWHKSHLNKNELRKKYNIPVDSYIVGSFQRDTEGHDLITPKLEKGPDLLADYIINIDRDKESTVVLAGWRRQYLIKRLTDANINFMYFEKPSQQILCELYQTLDVYPVTSRYEGGPQALLECGLLNIPVISRDIGIASHVLPQNAINNDVFYAMPTIPNVDNLILPNGFKPYRSLIEHIGQG